MRRVVLVLACGFFAVLLAFLTPLALVLPGSPIGLAGGARVPSSSILPLPEFTRDQVIGVEYRANGTAGQSGVFYVELFYRIPDETSWALYAPPWNPEGRWFGALGFRSPTMADGTIPFDTFFAGGERTYEFYTVAVDRGYKEEPPASTAKARTTLDTRPPQVFVASPAPNAWTNGKRLAWSATDAVSGLASVTAILDASPMDPFEVPLGAKAASGAGEMALGAEGDHDLTLRVADRAGNVAEVYVPFHYDPNAPVLAITAPTRNSFLNTRDVEVAWTAGDSGAGIASIRMSVDSNGPVEIPAGATSHMLEGLAETGHVVSLLVVDGAGNFAAETVAFGVDVTPPEVTLVSPRPGGEAYSNLRDQLQVLWTGSDRMSGIDRFVVHLVEADRASPDLESAAGFTFDRVTQGAHTVRVVAYDRAGNAREATATVMVDWTPPNVAITAPGRGAVVTGDVRVNWTATDAGSGIGKVELIYDSGVPILATGTATHRLQPTPTEGAHVVAVRVWDRAGNMAEAYAAFEYRTPGPTGPGPLGIPALDFWLLMLLIAAIAVGAAYFAVRRRKKAQA